MGESQTVIEPSRTIIDMSAVPAMKKTAKRKSKTSLPNDFGISDSVRAWATAKGHGRLEEHLEHFIGSAKANGYEYADWDAAFMNAVRNDWAKLRQSNARGSGGADARFAN